jgi:hypothetical protein
MISDERLSKAAEEELGLVKVAIEDLKAEAITTLSHANADDQTAIETRHELQALTRVAARLQRHIDNYTLKNSQS